LYRGRGAGACKRREPPGHELSTPGDGNACVFLADCLELASETVAIGDELARLGPRSRDGRREMRVQRRELFGVFLLEVGAFLRERLGGLDDLALLGIGQCFVVLHESFDVH
jgi:hypothetical protein